MPTFAGMSGVLAAFCILFTPTLALAQSCPALLNDARKLVMVTPDTMTSTTAKLQRYTRTSTNAPWRADGGPVTVTMGTGGTAWSPAFSSFSAGGEPIKTEGDKRVPAGIFALGRSFGHAPSKLRGYMQIKEGTTCVDDLTSPAYNTISSRDKVGWGVSGENMWRIPEYRRGIVVDYPTDRARRAGSCIFIHVRKPGAPGTQGCVSMPEADVERLQKFASTGAVLAIIPREAMSRFAGCLP